MKRKEAIFLIKIPKIAMYILKITPKTQKYSKSLINASKSEWKRMRVIMNPTFSSSKMREVSQIKKILESY